MLSELRQRVPSDYGRYLEPFAGSACLFFAINPERAVLSDFNAELMHAYRMLSLQPRKVARMCAGLPEGQDAYYWIRSLAPESLTELERAARFLYLNRYCFNGVYRTDRQNRFNVPYGTRVPPPMGEDEVARCSSALKRASLITGDFEAALNQADPHDFVYVDPPYSTSPRATYGEYGYGAFSHQDVDRLLGALRTLTERRVKVLFSYAADSRVIKSLEGWRIAKLRVRRRIAGGARNRNALEILASNFA